MINILYGLTAFLLLLMNAFFVAAEFGIIRLRQTRILAIKKIYGLRGRILADIHQHLDAYLSACQLGVTFSSIGLGWVAEPAFARLIKPLLQQAHITSQELTTLLGFLIPFTLISFLHIVIGELIPKSLALRQSEKVSLFCALPLYGFYWIMYPAIWVLNYCANFLLKKSGLDRTHKRENFYSTDEIKLILNTSHLHGELTKEEAEILEHTIDFADLKVTEVVRPQEEMVRFDINMPIAETLKIAASQRFSRYPVFEGDPNNIIGIVHVKDLFNILFDSHINQEEARCSNQMYATESSKADNKKESEILTHAKTPSALDAAPAAPLALAQVSLRTYLRPILKISQRMPALLLLRKFREGMPHFAVVYKNHDNLLGFLTLDNLLHILIGRIKDEFHLTQDDWLVNADGSLIVRGNCPLFSLERALEKELHFTHQEPAPETLAAAIINQLGRLPHLKEKIRFNDFTAIVLKMRGPKMTKIRVLPLVTPEKQ